MEPLSSTASLSRKNVYSTRKKETHNSKGQPSIELFFSVKTTASTRKKAKIPRSFQLITPTRPSNQLLSTNDSSETKTREPTRSNGNFLSDDRKDDEEMEHNALPRDQSSNVVSPDPKRHTNSSNFKQMYLDLGQANFGKQTICRTCGMLYVHGLAEDSLQHERICQDYRQGVAVHLTSFRVVGRYDDDTVAEVRPSDSHTSREKVMRVRTIVDHDLGFNSTDSSDQRTTYLYVRKKRVVGMATSEVLRKAFVLQSTQQRSKASTEAMVGIHQLWVHSNNRRQGIATRLVDAVRDKFVFGLRIPVKMLAFSSPTEAGANFARKYIQANDARGKCPLLIYDCN